MVWRSKPRIRPLVGSLAGAVVLCALLAGWAADGAVAKPDNATNEKRLDSTVRYLQNAQNMNGGFGLNAGEESNQDVSAWVAFALAAAGINPQDQRRPGGVDAYDYLADHAATALHEELCRPTICTTSLERELLVVDASGTSPDDFGGIDLVGELLARKLADGSFPFVPGGNGEVNDTIYAVLALSLVPGQATQEALASGVMWLLSAQNPDGSWPTLHPRAEGEGEVDMTGAAIEALNAPNLHVTELQKAEIEQAQAHAFGYLREAQLPDGGFPEFAGEGEANVASTAWAVQGMWSAAENPEDWLTSEGHEPLSYLETLQQPDGHIRYKASAEENGLWMTAQVAPAFAGQAQPIPAVPREVPSTPPSSGSGVLAGGGGNGAALFSRPQPQSKGETPGGVRLLAHRAKTRAGKHRRNPGAARTEPVATVTAEAPGAVRHANKRAAKRGRSPQAGGHDVKGIVIGGTSNASYRSALARGAPGLRSAAVGGEQGLSLAIALAATLLAFAGSLLERRRRQVVL